MIEIQSIIDTSIITDCNIKTGTTGVVFAIVFINYNYLAILTAISASKGKKPDIFRIKNDDNTTTCTQTSCFCHDT